MKPVWLDAECAHFIRRIINKRATDETRTVVARDCADWLEEHGDKEHAFWFRHPKLKWVHHEWGISWDVHPWDNNGHGCGSRIDNGWWAINFPTEAFLASPYCEWLVREWIKNGVDVRTYPKLRVAAVRLGIAATWDAKVAWWDELDASSKKLAEAAEERDRKDYERLWQKFSGKSPITSGSKQ
jgi:hypothetical protein